MVTTKRETLATGTSDKKENKLDIDWNKQIDKTIRFCNKRGFEVRKTMCEQGISTICFDDREILIHKRHNPERMFYTLLHEMGHMLIHENHQRYSQNVGYVTNKFVRESLVNRVGEVEEEFDAWRVGYKRAKKMRLKVNRNEYEKVKASYLSSYFMWAIQRKVNDKVKAAVQEATKKEK